MKTDNGECCQHFSSLKTDNGVLTTHTMYKLTINDLDLRGKRVFIRVDFNVPVKDGAFREDRDRDRKSTRLNSSQRCISYAVFCLKKIKTTHEYIVISPVS